MREHRIIKLSEADRRLLAVIEHRATESFSKVARLLRSKEHTVRYRFHGLCRRGVILERLPFIDMYKLGFCVFKIYCGLASEKEVARSKLIPYLQRLPQIMWLAQIGGDYQLVFSVCARQVSEIYVLLKELASKFGGVFSHTDMVVQVRFSAFGRNYLAPQVKPAPKLEFGFDTEDTVVIDATDDLILGALCQGRFRSENQLAQSLQIPLSTLLRRLKNLSKQGVLPGHIFRYDTALMGLHRYNLLVAAKGVSHLLSDRMHGFCAKHPNIVNLGECLGPWHFELAADVAAPYEAVEIMRELSEFFGSEVAHLKILPIFRSFKYSSYVARVGR